MYPRVYNNIPWLTKSPNIYLHHNPLPGFSLNQEPWTEAEKVLFISLLGKYGPGNWGVFSTHIPGRVGYQCANFYRELVKTGSIPAPDKALLESIDSNPPTTTLKNPSQEKNTQIPSEENRLLPKTQQTQKKIVNPLPPPRPLQRDPAADKENMFQNENKIVTAVPIKSTNQNEVLKRKIPLNSQQSPYIRNTNPKKIKSNSVPDPGSKEEVSESENPPKKEILNNNLKSNANPESNNSPKKENMNKRKSNLSKQPATPSQQKQQTLNNENLPNSIPNSSPPKKKQKPIISKTPTNKKTPVPPPEPEQESLLIISDSESESSSLPAPKSMSARKPFQPINMTPRLSSPFDDCEGIPIAQSKGDKGTVFLGNADIAKNLEWLKGSDIKAIVNGSTEIKNFYPDQFIYKKFPIIDSEDCKISKYFDESCDFINQHRSSGSVLVHCQKGQSRSVTLLFAYLIKYEGMTLQEVCDFFESNRIKTTMNIGFQQQIMIWEKKITKKNTKDFFARTPRIRRTPIKYSPYTYTRGYADT